MITMETAFNGPIPGESLTREPGNAPWEQPPQFAKVDEVLNFYMEKLEDDELFEDMLYILDNDMPLDLFIETMLLNGEMYGKHTSDVSLIVGPILHEHLLSLAEAAGVKVREFQGETKEERMKKKGIDDVQMSLDLTKKLPTPTEPEPVVEEIVEEELPSRPSRGLVRRRD
jgi:hypothetical protein